METIKAQQPSYGHVSFIRQTQEGSYVDIPGGSNYYIYGNGEDISGWSHGEFAALIGGIVDELPDGTVSQQARAEIREAFANHFGGWDEEYDGGITPPERAEIFCQCVDSRIEGLTLCDALHEAVREWADEFDALRECEYCGDEFRPYLYTEDTPYVCTNDECKLKREADLYGLTVEEERRARRIRDEVGVDASWEFIVEHSERDDLEGPDSSS